MEEIPTTLPAIIAKSGIDTEQAALIQAQFSNFLVQIKDWEDKAFKINITSLDQEFDIAEAKRAYTVVKQLRLSTEARRKDLKEDSLRKGKLIDGIANFVKDKLSPIEEHLEKQAKFAEIEQKKAKDKMVAERREALSKYVLDTSVYNLETMSQDTFDVTLENAREAFEKAEKDRTDQEAADLKKKELEDAENERIRKENEKLVADNLKKDADLKKANDEKKKLEDAEAKRLADEKRIQDEKDEKARQDKLAPERDKLFAYAESIKNITAPAGLSKAAQEIVKVAEKQLLGVSLKIKDSLKDL